MESSTSLYEQERLAQNLSSAVMTLIARESYIKS